MQVFFLKLIDVIFTYVSIIVLCTYDLALIKPCEDIFVNTWKMRISFMSRFTFSGSFMGSMIAFATVSSHALNVVD